MNFSAKKLPGSLMEIKGEMPFDEFEKYIKESFFQYNQESEIPGFRKGLAPDKIILEKIGEDKILERAARNAFKVIYPQILKECQIEALGLPEFHILKLARQNPLEFKIIVAFLPEVILPDYNKIAKESFADKEKIKVEDKEIENRIEQLKKIVETQSGNKQELNDEFAKKLGNFKNIEELKKAIAQNIEFEKQMKLKDKRRIEFLEKVLKEMKIELPKVLIDGEKKKMMLELQRSVGEMGLGWEAYLKQIKKNEEELLESFNDEAYRRVSFGLILREIAKKENIEVFEEEVQNFINNYKRFRPEEKIDRDYVYGLLKNEKTFAALEKIK